MKQDEIERNYEKVPRGSWATNQMGNPELNASINPWKMKSIKLAISLGLLSLGFLAQAQSLYDIFASSQGINFGYGQITLKNGFAISGYFDVTNSLAIKGSGVDPFASFVLWGGTATYPNYLPSNYSRPPIEYDNAIYFSSNPQYPNTNPLLDWYGLYFLDTNNPVEPVPVNYTTPQLNLYAVSDDGINSYAILGNGRTGLTNIQISIIPAPEPSSVAVIALMLVPVGAIFYQRRMIRRSEAVVLLLK
jgi:hypothetical protein